MKLYVGNLPWSIDDKALKELFSSYDVEEANLIKDKFTRRSKGFGFVTIPDDEKAKEAISEMHQKEIEGRPLTVSEARPMTPRNDFNKSTEAPTAKPEEINEEVKDSVNEESPEVIDNNSDAEAGEKPIETAEEAMEDAENKKTE